MLDCPRCAAPLPLTLPSCACGADVREAAEGVGLVCAACDTWSPPGAPQCTACGTAFGAAPDADAELPTIDLDLVVEPEPAPDSPEPDPFALAPEPEPFDVAPEAPVCPEPGRAALRAQPEPSTQASADPPPSEPAPATLPPAGTPSGPPMLLRTGRARGAAIRQALPAASARLRVASVRPDGSSASVLLGEAAVLCGRSDADLLVPGDTVSRHHARFTARDGRAVVEDLGSLNGTWIRLRAPRAAGYGDELRVGDRRLRLAYSPGGAMLEEIATGGATLAVHALRPGITVLGSDGDVRLDGLEPMHARLETTAAGYSVTDLGSRTGTWLRLAAPEPVAAGDEILLGAERLRVDEP